MRSVDFISYAGDTLALFAPPCDWSAPMKLTVTLPSDATPSILKNESRRVFATSQRYDMEFKVTTDNAADSNDIRAWINRLKVETVAVPLYMDEIQLAAPVNPGDVSLAISGELPARYGAEWIILADDGSAFEIVIVTSLSPSTATIGTPGTEFAWPGGTALYPLAFGYLAELPVLDLISDEAFSATFKFHENSAFARQLSPRFLPPDLVGSHVPDFALFKLWTLEPDFVELHDWTESDILYHRIPPTISRQEQAYAYQNWNRRGLEMQFTCQSRDEIAAVEYFLNDRQGIAQPFFIPTHRGDLRLAADVAKGAATFQIEESRYEIASYDSQPWNAFLCFIDLLDGQPSDPFPQRITNVNETTIKPQVPVGEDHSAADTIVSFLMLVRFLEPVIEWEYDADNLAKVRIKFIELPSEYTTPAPVISPPAYLYRFTEQTPTPNEFFFTSYETARTYSGKTYLPAPFSHDKITAKKDLTDDVTLTSWGGSFVGNPLAKWLPFTLNAIMTLTITRVNSSNPGDGKARVLFFGDIMSVDMTGPDWTAQIKFFGRRLDRNFPRFDFQQPDNFTIFTAPTQLADTTFKKTGTIASMSGFTVTASPINFATDWFSNGRLETGTGANFERRSILKSTAAGSLQTLTLDRPLIFAVVGQAVTIWPGYDQTRDQCQIKFNNNVNFGGHPYMPLTNPTIKTIDIQTPTGGKK
jgi:hypothetical protein